MRKLPVISGIFQALALADLPLRGQESFICRDNYYIALTDGPVLTTVYEVRVDPGSGNVVFEALSAGTSGADLNGIGMELDLGPDRQVELGEGLRLRPERISSTEGLTYSWSSSAGPVDCADCIETFVEPRADTRYYLTATDTAGCFVKDSVLVKVLKDRRLFLPNAFSPNGDGVNDYFYP